HHAVDAGGHRACEFANHLFLLVGDGDRHFLAGVRLEVVVDVCAERRIGRGEDAFAPDRAFGQVVKFRRRSEAEEVNVRSHHFRRHLLKGSDVVEYKDTAPMSADHQIAVARVNHYVVNGDGRQGVIQPDPRAPAIEREPEAEFSAGVKQIAVDGVFAHDFDRAAGGQVAGNRTPRLTEIICHEYERTEHVVAVAVNRDVSRAFFNVRSLDAADPEAFHFGGQVRGQVIPGFALVGRHPEFAVVGARPDYSGLERRFGKRVDRAMRFRARPGDGDLLRVLSGQVGADLLPLVAALGQLEEMIAAEVKRARRVPRGLERRSPVEAESGLAFLRLRLNVSGLPGLQIEAIGKAVLRFGVDYFR